MIAKSVCRYLSLVTGSLICMTLGAQRAGAEEFDSAAIVAAFAESADGYSSDELLIQDRLRNRFLEVLARDGVDTDDPNTQRDVLLTLIKIRKAGKLAQRATRRGPVTDQAIIPVAEIAARVVADRHRITSDTILADPRHRLELQQEAELIDSDVDAYQVRKAVLFLRKSRRLRPELVLKVADWQREIRTLTLKDLESQLESNQIPPLPGVYLFRNAESYLYIGEAANLADRLKQHTGASDRQTLAQYLASDDADQVTVELHLFPKDSPAAKTTVRRAYESELIRSREPLFNVRP